MDSVLFEKLNRLRHRFAELEARLSIPEITQDAERFRSLRKEYSQIEPVMTAYSEYCRAEHDLKQAKDLLESGYADAELIELAGQECRFCAETMERLTDTIRYLLSPRDPDDDKGVMIEIRAAAGGEEAALFASDLYRMYTMYAGARGLTTSVMASNPTGLGGYRTISFSVEGERAFSHFRYESGVHRVQRIPKTESQGRIQTSTVTVAVLPQAEDVEITINPADLSFESMKSSGAGGQHINKTESAVRLTHKPSGIVIECDGERSQFKNKETALKMLRARLYEISKQEKQDEISSRRREQVGTGERCERIRTYNFPQSRVTDHRIGFVSHSLESVLNGDMEELIRALHDAHISQLSKETEE